MSQLEYSAWSLNLIAQFDPSVWSLGLIPQFDPSAYPSAWLVWFALTHNLIQLDCLAYFELDTKAKNPKKFGYECPKIGFEKTWPTNQGSHLATKIKGSVIKGESISP